MPSMYRVLVVDDEAEIRRALSAYYPWNELGFVVSAQAKDAEEARSLVEAGGIDLVLSDIRMPGSSGLELAGWISRAHPGTVVVLLSAFRKFEYAQEALNRGVRAYIVKPPAMGEFRALLSEIKAELDLSSADTLTRGGPVGVVKDYVRGNLGSCSLEGAARAVGMSPSYLSAWFLERSGEHFSDFVLRSRMELAARLLGDRRESVVEVSAELGYSNPKNFSRAFRAFYGSSPRDWRRSLESGGGPSGGLA
jgi:two-component system response regulator YesN